MIDKEIEDKEKEIEHYKGVLDRYVSKPHGTLRWLDQGRRHLQELEEQLKELQQKQQDTI